jgi:hypothetical protein
MATQAHVDAEVFQMLVKDKRARNLVRGILWCEAIVTKNYPLFPESETREENELQAKGLITSDYSGIQRRTTYRLPPAWNEAKRCVGPQPEITSELSDAVVYSQADKDSAQILHYYDGKRVVLNGMEGLLLSEKGELYHITRDEGQAPLTDGNRSQKPIIRKTSIPVKALRVDGDGLTIRNENIIISNYYYPDHYYPDHPMFVRLDKLLFDAGVKGVYQ